MKERYTRKNHWQQNKETGHQDPTVCFFLPKWKCLFELFVLFQTTNHQVFFLYKSLIRLSTWKNKQYYFFPCYSICPYSSSCCYTYNLSLCNRLWCYKLMYVMSVLMPTEKLFDWEEGHAKLLHFHFFQFSRHSNNAHCCLEMVYYPFTLYKNGPEWSRMQLKDGSMNAYVHKINARTRWLDMMMMAASSYWWFT